MTAAARGRSADGSRFPYAVAIHPWVHEKQPEVESQPTPPVPRRCTRVRTKLTAHEGLHKLGGRSDSLPAFGRRNAAHSAAPGSQLFVDVGQAIGTPRATGLRC